MDLLSKAYDSNGSDNEDEPDPIIPPPPKRSRPAYPPVYGPDPTRVSNPVPGRYISKREKALLSSQTLIPVIPNPNPNSTSSVTGNLSNANLRHDILLSLRQPISLFTGKMKLSSGLSVELNGHTKSVNAVHWSKNHAHLLASAGMDNAINIWNVWNKQQKLARKFTCHNAAVKDVKWSAQGHLILSCGYDCLSRLVDVEKGLETQFFSENQPVTAIEFHPHNSNLFLSGGLKGSLKMWDIRVGKVVHEYVRRLGPILDVEFMVDGKQFISSSDVSDSNLSENSLIVWDVSREVPLSNQVYAEAYTCPSVKCHPFEPFFVAQTNGNYMAIFSTKHPFRLDKYKRYESHGVFGFPVKCGFSLDGLTLASGSSDGTIYFYNVRSSHIVEKIKAYDQPCVDVAFHPIMPNVVASCSWSGHVSVFE